MHDDRTVEFIGLIRPSGHGFDLVLNTKYAEALEGLEAFSHAIVLWWASEADLKNDRARTVCRKPYVNNPNNVGVFASRSPARPNPICMSVVHLQNIDQNTATIKVPYIDTLPDTPIIDIKPYFPASDRVMEVRSPDWCQHWPGSFEASAEFDWEGEFH